jgi:glycosyltransferase involved in cell wall biosynthesis
MFRLDVHPGDGRPAVSRKRLAIVSPGGIGAGAFAQGLPAIGSLVAGLAERFEVTFYSLAPVDPGFAPERFRLSAPAATVDSMPINSIRGARWADLARRFLVHHRAAGYDRMLSLWGYPMGAFAVGLGRALRVPVAVMLLGAETANVPQIGYGHFRGGLSRRLVLETCRHADALVAVSQAQLGALAARGLVRADAQLVPIGAESELFPFVPRTQRPPRPPLKIVHVGNLTAVKDQATLLRAFAQLRAGAAGDARLRIIGEGALRGALEQLARELGLGDAVEMPGAVPFRQMPDHYRWADMFVLTSLSEGQNRALTEAAMCGVLNVSTPVGHIADLGEAAAVVVRAGDPRDVADRIAAIARDAEGWERRVRAARAWAAAHDLAWTVDRMTEVIDRLDRLGAP